MVDFVVPHDPNWKTDFDAEAQSIAALLAACNITLHHIGSTAIAGILAKPIIDLMGEVRDLEQLDEHAHHLETIGYEVMGAFGIEGRRYFRKVDAAGTRTHHLHIYGYGSPHVERHLAFRDYLRHHADIAAEYSNLKASLFDEKEQSWDGYLDGKDPFIKAVEQDALHWFRNKKGPPAKAAPSLL